MRRTAAGLVLIAACSEAGSGVTLSPKALPAPFPHARLSQVLRKASLSDFDVVVEATGEGLVEIKVNGQSVQAEALSKRLSALAGDHAAGKDPRPSPSQYGTNVRVNQDGGVWIDSKPGGSLQQLADLPSAEGARLVFDPSRRWRHMVEALTALALQKAHGVSIGLSAGLVKGGALPAAPFSGTPPSLSDYQRQTRADGAGGYRAAAVLLSISEGMQLSTVGYLLNALAEVGLENLSVHVDAGAIDAVAVLPLDFLAPGLVRKEALPVRPGRPK